MISESRPLETAAEVLDYLYDLRLFGTKLGLENPRRLSERLGSPHRQLNFIHVAGTNGKGSVCAFLESVYRAAGYRVGLFTSPHLVHFGERIQVNRQPLPDNQLVTLVNEIRTVLATLRQDHHPTFFEIVAVLGALHFCREKCDVVIWETGMGGRLDATNIVDPIMTIITNVSSDHQQWLGDTIAKIAGEKAGIMKPSVPLVHGVKDPEALNVVENRARELGILIETADRSKFEGIMPTPELGLLGSHQLDNAALVWRTIDLLQDRLPVKEADLRSGLADVRWPGRMQRILRADQEIILDCAHNDASIEALCHYLDEHVGGQSICAILGVLEDKGFERWLPMLLERVSELRVVAVKSGRTVLPEKVLEFAKEQHTPIPVSGFSELREALGDGVERKPLLLICGSVYLIGEAMSLLNDEALNPTHSALNEWGKRSG